MDKATLKLLELKEALEKALKLSSKAAALPSPKAPKMPTNPHIEAIVIDMPKQPNLTPNSKKDPTKQAEQIKDPSMKNQAMKQAKEKLKLSKNGQWSL